jgi:hypothetical protein
LFFIFLIAICLFLSFLIDFFFNFTPHHLISFIFYIKFDMHSFDCCLFVCFNYFSNWILFSISSLNIWFQIIFILNLVSIILIVISFVLDLFIAFFLFLPLVFWWFGTSLRYFLGFAFCGISFGLMIRVMSF